MEDDSETVCVDCVDDEFLKAVVQENADEPGCSFCEGRAPASSLEPLVEAINDAVRTRYCDAAAVLLYDGREGGYQGAARPRGKRAGSSSRHRPARPRFRARLDSGGGLFFRLNGAPVLIAYRRRTQPNLRHGGTGPAPSMPSRGRLPTHIRRAQAWGSRLGRAAAVRGRLRAAVVPTREWLRWPQVLLRSAHGGGLDA